MFFVFDLPEVEEDARYVQEHHFPEFQLDDLDITKVTRLRQQSLILDLSAIVHVMLSNVRP